MIVDELIAYIHNDIKRSNHYLDDATALETWKCSATPVKSP